MIIEGKIINHDSQSYGQIKIDDSGVIEAVGADLGKPDLKTDGLIFPGFVDVHVHAREDASASHNYKEDYETMSQAAISGGVVAVCDMPNNPVPPVNKETYAEKAELSAKSMVDVVLYAGIGPQTEPLSLKVPYKVYMGKSIGDLFFGSLHTLDEAMSSYKGQNVSFHCEDPKILEEHAMDSTHEERRPREAEINAVEFAINLIRKYNLQGKLCHISTKESLELVRKAKRDGVQVTCEVTPHHLYFEGTAFRVNPPLRKTEDRIALIAGLKEGIIDYLASDHAPHTREEQGQGVSGLAHLDTYGAFATWLMSEHKFTPEEIARVCSYNPGRFLNEFSTRKFGQIERGYTGSLSIIDPNSRLTIRAADLKTKCGWSPFEGVSFPGRVTYTIIRGKVYDS